MKYLITGCTGFLAEPLTQRLLKKGHQIVGVARNEGKLVEYKEKFPEVEIITGDIADSWTVKKAMKGVDGVFHLAAYKHVGLAENNVFQCIRSNVEGTLNILTESLNTKPNFVIGISTDKAAQVAGVYGATKLLMEGLFKEVEELNPDTDYRIVRYGNVLYSTGSVMCKWKDKMLKGEEIIITDPEATRFFWTRDEAIDLIEFCLTSAKDSKPYIPEMKAMRIGDILEAMRQKYGNSEVKQIGLQPGENLHETLDGKVFSNDVDKFTINEILQKI